MSRVFAALVAGVVGYGMSLGLPREQLLTAARVTEEQLADPDGLVPYPALTAIWRVLVEAFPDQPLGLRYAAMQQLELYGLVGQLCMAARNGAESLRILLRYVHLLDPYIELTLGEVDAGYRVSIGHEPEVYALGEPLEMIVAATVRVTSQAVGVENALPREVAFRHAPRHPRSVYEQYFDCPVRFEADHDGATYDPALLHAPMAGSNPTVARYLQRLAERMSSERDPQRPPKSPLLSRLHDSFDEALADGDPSAGAVARRLGMSARTLQRRLSGEGTTFRAELEDHRRAMAESLLRDPMRNVQEVAFLLGYADPAHFFRSFRKWTGTTPQAWRQARS